MYKFLHLFLGYIQTRLIIKSVLVGREKNPRGKEKLDFFYDGVCSVSSFLAFWPGLMEMHKSLRFTASVKVGNKARIRLSP